MFDLQHPDRFVHRHIGPDQSALKTMLDTIGVDSLDTLIEQTVPANIRHQAPLNLPAALSEYDYLKHLRTIADQNEVFTSYIGFFQIITSRLKVSKHFFYIESSFISRNSRF